MSHTPDTTSDTTYCDLLLTPLRECRTYRPAFGREGEAGVSLPEFRALYGADPLYHWIGLDSELMYAAHKAAGGMTSVYRQLGIGCERLLRQIIADSLKLDDTAVAWAYEYLKDDGSSGIHTLDARIDLGHIHEANDRARVKGWIVDAGQTLGLSVERSDSLRGLVLEVRQGYKSADSKRQNADLRFGLRAYNENYLPMLAVVSTQVSAPVCRRYTAAQILVLLGSPSGSPAVSTFAFFGSVVGYDLSAFFQRNSDRLRAEFTAIIEALLRP